MLGFGKKATHRKALVEKATKEAETGRRLVIYDRDTGLYAYWYLRQRFEEEARRAKRYSHDLSLMVIEVNGDKGFASRDSVTGWLRQSTRDSDLATHLGDGRYLVLMTETDADAASIIARRLQAEVAGNVAVGLSLFPEDGTTLGDLQELAFRCLSISRPSAQVA